MPRSSNSWPGWANRTTDARNRLDSSSRCGPKTGTRIDRAVVGALALAPRARQLDLREVLRERADRRADRHLVVVDDDQHLGLALADVVERLERQAAHQRGVADHDRDALHPVAQVARLGEALGDRQSRSRRDRHRTRRAATRCGAGSRRRHRASGASGSGRGDRSGACAGRPGGRCPRRSGRAATRAVDGGRSSARRRRATSRGGRRSRRRSRRSSRGSRRRAGTSSGSVIPRRSAGPCRS